MGIGSTDWPLSHWRCTKMMAVRIRWKINGRTGHGSAIDAGVAVETVKIMNKKYGAGTHWVEMCV